MTTVEPATLTVEFLDPRELVPHPRNVRADLGDLTGLTASIAEQGVLEPLTVIPVDVERMILAGHRRAAAAIAAGLERVPCIVRSDLSIDDVATGEVEEAVKRTAAEAIAAMLAENLHRANLTTVEEARGVQAMLDLGVNISTVARRTGLDRKRVAKAAGVARLEAATAAAVTSAGLTLDQAAVLARFEDAPDVVNGLVEAATKGPGWFAHAVTRAEQDRKIARRIAKRRAELESAGRTVVDTVPSTGKRISGLLHDGDVLTDESHADCPGSAVYLDAGAGDLFTAEICTDWAAHGHADRWARDPRGTAGASMSDKELERQRTERRLVIENNKQMAAANSTRRAWIKDFLSRRSAPKEVLRFAVEEIAASPDAVHGWLFGGFTQESQAAVRELGLERPSRWRQTDVTLTTGEQVPDGRLPLQLFAHIAAAIEGGLLKDSWRRKDRDLEQLVRWLRFLSGQGYTLSDVEQGVVGSSEPGPARSTEAEREAIVAEYGGLGLDRSHIDDAVAEDIADGAIDPYSEENWIDGGADGREP